MVDSSTTKKKKTIPPILAEVLMRTHLELAEMETEPEDREFRLREAKKLEAMTKRKFGAYDDEISRIGTKLAFALMTRGFVKFPEFREKMLELVGEKAEKVDPYIPMFYMGAKLHPKIVANKLPVTSHAEVIKFLEGQAEGGENTATDEPQEIPVPEETPTEPETSETTQDREYEKQMSPIVAEVMRKTLLELAETELENREFRLREVKKLEAMKFRDFNAEEFSLGAQLASAMFQKGIHSFKDFYNEMIQFVPGLEPYFASFYMGGKMTPEIQALKLPLNTEQEVRDFLEGQKESVMNLANSLANTAAIVDPPGMAHSLEVWKKWRSLLQASPGTYGRQYQLLLDEANQVIKWKETGVWEKPEMREERGKT